MTLPARYLRRQAGEFNKMGGLYADVRPQYLPMTRLIELGFSRRLTPRKRIWPGGAGQDLAVVLFSGHGVTRR